MDPTIPSYSWDSDEETEHSTKTKKHKRTAAILEDQEWKDVAEALRTTLNCKAPGRDQIPNFWLTQLTATHRHIAAIFNKLTGEDQIPEWLTAGVTFPIPKNENTENPKNYRPVNCLPTVYKLLHLL